MLLLRQFDNLIPETNMKKLIWISLLAIAVGLRAADTAPTNSSATNAPRP
jgi:hypothetical protein